MIEDEWMEAEHLLRDDEEMVEQDTTDDDDTASDDEWQPRKQVRNHTPPFTRSMRKRHRK